MEATSVARHLVHMVHEEMEPITRLERTISTPDKVYTLFWILETDFWR